MNERHGARSERVRYLRIPHWVKPEYKCFQPRAPFFDVRLKAREHLVQDRGLSVRGILFETEKALAYATCVKISLRLSDDSMPFEFDCRIVRSQKIEEDHRYRVTAEFIARTREEINRIASFVKKYF